METITLEIPQIIWNSEKNESQLKKNLFELLILQQYQAANITIRQGADLLNISYKEFIELLGKYRMTFINTDINELEENYSSFEKTEIKNKISVDSFISKWAGFLQDKNTEDSKHNYLLEKYK